MSIQSVGECEPTREKEREAECVCVCERERETVNKWAVKHKSKKQERN